MKKTISVMLSFLLAFNVFFYEVPQAHALTLTDSLVSYWTLDETSGTRVDTPGANDLTDNNTVLYGTGVISNGGDFESTQSENLSIADASQSGLDLTVLSINAWVKFESYSSGVQYMIASKWVHAVQNQYMFFVESGVLDFHVANACANYDYTGVTSAFVPTPGTWYMVTVTYSGSVATLYIDGSQVTQTTPSEAIKNCTGVFRIGSYGATAGGFFDGLIDEVGIWSRAITSTEVTSLYNSGAGFAYPFTAAAPASAQNIILFE